MTNISIAQNCLSQEEEACKACDQEILVNGLCAGGPDEEECAAELPGFWAAIAAVLWPGYWDPKVSQIHMLYSPSG